MTTHRTTTVLTALLLVAATPSWVLAQEEKDPDAVPTVKSLPPDEVAAQAGVTEEIPPDEAGGKSGVKGETSEPAIANDLSFHMAPVLSFQPRRIAPGATGDAHLVLSMQRGSVLAVGSHFDLVYAREQGSVTLGEWTLGEPAIGAANGAFKARPVYENYAQVTIPVMVDPDTPHGTYPIHMMIVAEITDGASGSPMRRAQTQARAQLVVGPALPTPNAPAAGARPREITGTLGPTADQPGEALADGAADPAAGSGGRDPIRATRSEPSAGSPDSPEGVDGPGSGPPVERGGGSMLWIGLGGGLVALLALLLALRKR